MRAAWALVVLAVVAACGATDGEGALIDVAPADGAPTDGNGPADVPAVTPDDTPLPECAPCADDVAAPDASPPDVPGSPADTSDAPDTSGCNCPAFGLSAPASVPPGAPFVVVVAAADPDPSGAGPAWARQPARRTVTLQWGGQDVPVTLYRGWGSARLVADAPGEVALVGTGVVRAVGVEARPERALTGDLTGNALTWDAQADLVLTGATRVPVGATLTVGPGTRVRLGPLASLEIAGAAEIAGTAEAPVAFAPQTEPWGGVVVRGTLTADHFALTGGGGDGGQVFGHSSSQPVIFAAEGATLTLRHAVLADNPGKALGSQKAQVTVADSLITRCDTGGELADSKVAFERTRVVELPDADGVYADDDNDGLYLVGTHLDGDQPVRSTIRDSVFAVGEDDAIDHNDATLTVERVSIDGFRHEGVAASYGHSVDVVDSWITGCEQGVESGYGSPAVTVTGSVVTGNGTGVRLGDSYGWATSGTLRVERSVVVGNGQNVRNHVNALGGPLEGAVAIACSLVDSPEWDGVDGNVAGAPDASSGCLVPAPQACGEALGQAACP